jgi:hypothetical protein
MPEYYHKLLQQCFDIRKITAKMIQSYLRWIEPENEPAIWRSSKSPERKLRKLLRNCLNSTSETK